MLNAVGYVIKQANGRCLGNHRTVSITADIDHLPNIRRTADTQLDFRMMIEGVEIGAGWAHKSEASNKEYVNFSIVASESRPKKLYANLGKAADLNDKDLYAVIRIRFDKTKAPARVLHGGNHL
jgi:uncharacterized protein (DUF736 family)